MELGNKIDLILDGGSCRVGIESTVLDLSGPIPTVLRPGAITPEQIGAEIGNVRMGAGRLAPGVIAASPGQRAMHYAPRLPAYRLDRSEFAGAAQQLLSGSQKMAVLSVGQLPTDAVPGQFHLIRELSPVVDSYAHDLYAALREADASGAELILVEMPPDEPRWLAVRDRIWRATRALPTY